MSFWNDLFSRLQALGSRTLCFHSEPEIPEQLQHSSRHNGQKEGPDESGLVFDYQMRADPGTGDLAGSHYQAHEKDRLSCDKKEYQGSEVTGEVRGLGSSGGLFQIHPCQGYLGYRPE